MIYGASNSCLLYLAGYIYPFYKEIQNMATFSASTDQPDSPGY